MADWKKIKTEYITTDTSYRKLAEKYGLNKDTIHRRAKAESWEALRRQHIDRVQTRTLDAVCDQQVNRAAKLQSVADLLLTKVNDYLQRMEVEDIGTSAMKNISGVLKDLKEIQMIRSDADMREQEARIANLQKQAAADNDDDDETGVVLLPPVKGG